MLPDSSEMEDIPFLNFLHFFSPAATSTVVSEIKKVHYMTKNKQNVALNTLQWLSENSVKLLSELGTYQKSGEFLWN